MTYLGDLSNQHFGRWTVLSFAHKQSYENFWNCRCSCGTERAVAAKSLMRGRSISCGCFQKEVARKSRFVDLTGKQFYNLTVEKFIGYKGTHRQSYWECLCSCGNRIIVLSRSLLTGNTKGCGCLIGRGGLRKDLTGIRFNRLLVVGYAKYYKSSPRKRSTQWVCLCDCGNVRVMRSSPLVGGTVKSCGCYFKEFCVTHCMSQTKIYNNWLGKKYRDKKHSLDYFWTFEMEVVLRKLFKECVICGSTKRLCTDHILPLALGYGLAVDNATILCQSCNSIKNNKYITELAPEIRRKLIDASCAFQNYWESVGY